MAHITPGPQHSLIKSKGQYFKCSVGYHKTIITFTLTMISSLAALHYQLKLKDQNKSTGTRNT